MSEAQPSLAQVRQWFQQGVEHEVQLWLDQQLSQPTAEIWGLQAALWERQGKRDRAWEAYQAALMLEPESASVHAALATLGLQTGAVLSSRHHAEAARAFAPEVPLYTRLLVGILLLQGERAEALLYVRELLQLEPEAPSSFALLGQVMYLFGQRELASQALQQSLELDPEQGELYFLLMWWALGQRQWAEALRWGLAYQDSSGRSDTAQKALGLHIWACTLASQGELAQARETWQQALALDFQATFLFAYSLSAPLVYASPEQMAQWQQILAQALALLQGQQAVLADSYFWLELPLTPLPAALSAPVHQLWSRCRGEAAKTEALLEPLIQRTPPWGTSARGVLLVSDLADQAVSDWIFQFLSHARHPELAWQVVYLFPGGLPERFAPWADRFLQAPVHALALPRFVAQLEADLLLYLQVERELSHVLVQKIGPLQLCVPSPQIPDGLPFDAELAPFGVLACPAVWPAEQPRWRREDFDLPRLGHVYLLPAEPDCWLPEWDAWLAELLRQDRKAFVYGFQRVGTALHSHVQQRLAESLGDRQHRVRWLDVLPHQRWQILHLVDAVVQLPGMDVAWLAFQAVVQGVPAFDLTDRSAFGISLLQADLAMLRLPFHPAQIQRLCSWITERSERVILSEALEEARPRLLDQADGVAALEQQVQTEWMRRNQHA